MRTEKEAIKQLKRVSKNLGCIGEQYDYTDIGINALEKQIPKKPVAFADSTFFDMTLGCPNCKNGAIINPCTRKYDYLYCPQCGQKLDWSK